jgi:HEPN domain-containing protein
MPHDPVKVEDTKTWLSRAEYDLKAAAFEMTASPPFLADVAFHAQQAVEKSLKAFLTWRDEPFRKTHNLIELGEQCAVLEPSLEPLMRKAAPLSAYAWKFRYPHGENEPSHDEAVAALALARDIFDFISRLLFPEPN